MRIAFICADIGIPVFGCKGASVHIQEMLRSFIAQGAHVTLLSPRMEDAPPVDLEETECVCLPYSSDPDPLRRAHLSIGINSTITETLRLRTPFDLIYERHSLYTDAPMLFALHHDIPSVLEINAPLIEEQQRHRVLSLHREAKRAAHHSISAARTVTVVSTDVARYAVDHGASPDSVHVIENAVNPRRFAAGPRPEGPFTVGFLGTLKPWHDVATLVEGFAGLSRLGFDSRLLIVGDGPERGSLKARIGEMGLGSVVEFTGSISPAAVPEQLARMHVGVAPYRADDPFYFSPLKIYEYMAAGLPVIASEVGNLDTIVTHGHNGLLVEPDSADAMTQALAEMAADPKRAERLGQTGRAYVTQNHDWDTVAARILSLATTSAKTHLQVS